MHRVIRTVQARRDLTSIWVYVAERNLPAADRLIGRFDERVNQLAEFPYLGEAQPQFGDNIRRIIVGNYLVFYEVTDDQIRILRVFHSARKIEDLLE